jgi:pyridinium-3,5-biscarboxylic acid mononucleotide sulfurtransferase
VDEAQPDAGAEALEARVAAGLREARSACVAVSGGVDSSLVLAVAARALGGDHVVAVTATAPVMIAGEAEAAAALAGRLGVPHVLVEVPVMDEPRFVANPRERCYVCKGMVLDAVRRVAVARGCDAVFDGANRDDLGDERPGMRAAAERGVRHPLLEAGLGKREVRALARALGLEAWDAPSQACLASRVPYGTPLTDGVLRRVAAAERALRQLGYARCRVRAHGDVARVELPPDEAARAAGTDAGEIARRVRAAGFTYVALDLDGLRSGSMNEARAADGEPAENGGVAPHAGDRPQGDAGVVP